MLPKVDGFELIVYIKQKDIPVIFLAAKNSVVDKVKGLRLGADDYIVKPFESIELLARRYNKNIALSREQILDKVWGFDYMGETRTIDMQLRDKLNLKNNIKTVFKVGYRLNIKIEYL